MFIYIAALVKNCQDTLKQNIDFIIDYNKTYRSKHQIKLLILENDSIDDTKKILNEYSNNNLIQIFSQNGLEDKIFNRIERITYCRNFMFEKIIDISSEDSDILYIPADFDIDLFSGQTVEEFHNVIDFVINNKEIDAIFPNCSPYYYDIHALRKAGWNLNDAWKNYEKLSKYIPIGKFFLKYYFIYRKQIKIIKGEDIIKVESAFGGIGVYWIKKGQLGLFKYNSDQKFEKCEHIDFNSNFRSGIYTSWIINSPTEHIEYKMLNLQKKLLFILRSIMLDFKNLFLYLFSKKP
ncbi:MAG: hypothetical protein CBE33_02095 [Candidatus Pelagibacter sp. TMED273]|nr:MAG: hypothetical protein CBE33_02095 [Candidatus Pelagibacter sp. TMED273]|tara:strand:+ start:5595 stop:6473 length:879 start_codon:yes stop_codon:yes gene_type:complete